MTTKPLVSIMTSCYNHEKYLDDYFRGLLSQTYTHIELILFDDGSTDGSWEKIKSYESKLSQKFSKVVLERHENMTARKELALAIERATGAYLCWLDSDDYYFPTKVEKNVACLESHPKVGVVHSDLHILRHGHLEETHWKSSHTAIPKGNVLNDLLLGTFYVNPVVACFRTDLVRRYVNFNQYTEKKYPMTDVPMFLDLAAHTQFGYIDESLVCYRVSQNSMAHPTDPENLMRFRRSMCQVGRDYAEKYDVSDDVKKQVVKSYYLEHFNTGYD
ncbi:MAG: glycosyltransferase family 2 protein, partial [Candidatus Omnitrophica bacterium]|nr:glycosyltransferase family 2 protein [Candidatus Omnitrophota bacterium]